MLNGSRLLSFGFPDRMRHLDQRGGVFVRGEDRAIVVRKHDIVAANLLAKKIKPGRLPNPFTARDVYNNGWSGLSSPEDVEKAVEILEEAFWVKSEKINTGGRPKFQYRINPKLRGRVDGDE